VKVDKNREVRQVTTVTREGILGGNTPENRGSHAGEIQQVDLIKGVT